MITLAKDPDATRPFGFDWSKNLPAGDTIASALVTVATGLTKAATTITTDQRGVVVWLSGGTPGNTYSVSCRVTTTQGIVDDYTYGVQIADR